MNEEQKKEFYELCGKQQYMPPDFFIEYIEVKTNEIYIMINKFIKQAKQEERERIIKELEKMNINDKYSYILRDKLQELKQ